MTTGSLSEPCINWPCAKGAGHAGPCSTSRDFLSSNERADRLDANVSLFTLDKYASDTRPADIEFREVHELCKEIERLTRENASLSEPPEDGPLTIDGHQVAALVDFLDLNGGPEGRETELCLRYYAEDRMEPGKHGEPMPAGLYAWFKEYPEEGQLLLVPYEDAVTKSEEPEPEHVCDGGWACHFHDVKKATDETSASRGIHPNCTPPCPICDE